MTSKLCIFPFFMFIIFFPFLYFYFFEATAEAEITAATAEVEFVIDIATETVVGPTTVDPLVDVVEHGENLDYIVDVSTTQTPARESIIYIGLGHLIMHFSLFIVFFL